MLRMLFVDDEYMEREAMKTIMEKKFVGQYEVRLAANGKEAIEEAKRFSPHLIFMDIKMPGCSGIDASKEIRKLLPNVLIVFVTAYDYFDYAKEAVSLNAEEFLLKPVEIDVVCELINKLTQKIYAQLQKSAYNQKIEDKFEMISRQLEHELFLLIEDIGTSEEQVLDFFSIMDINFQGAVAATIDFSKFQADENMNIMQKSFLKTRFLEKIRNQCKIKQIMLFPEITGDLTRLLFVYQKEARQQMVYEEINNMLKDAIGIMRISFEFAISHYITTVTQLREIIMSSSYKLLGEKVQEGDCYPYQLEKQFLEAIHKGELERAKAHLIKIADVFQKQYLYKAEFTRKVVELYTVTKRSLREKDKAYEVLFRYEDEQAQKIGNRDEMIFFFEGQLEYVGSRIDKRANKNELLIKKVCDYVEENYQKDISLEEVSSYVGFSTFYFTKLMKEHLNMSFIDYLVSVRIKKAKKLFETTEKNISEVSYEVGYEDPNYFTRVFKKIVGVTPSIYKNKGQIDKK